MNGVSLLLRNLGVGEVFLEKKGTIDENDIQLPSVTLFVG